MGWLDPARSQPSPHPIDAHHPFQLSNTSVHPNLPTTSSPTHENTPTISSLSRCRSPDPAPPPHTISSSSFARRHIVPEFAGCCRTDTSNVPSAVFQAGTSTHPKPAARFGVQVFARTLILPRRSGEGGLFILALKKSRGISRGLAEPLCGRATAAALRGVGSGREVSLRSLQDTMRRVSYS